MMRRNILLCLTLILIAGIIFVGYRWNNETEPSLFIHMSCKGEVSGKLSVAMILPNGELGNSKSYDIKSICKMNNFEMAEYSIDNDIHFTLETSDGKKHKLVSKYGENITSDPDAFNVIIAITDTSPFIANERL